MVELLLLFLMRFDGFVIGVDVFFRGVVSNDWRWYSREIFCVLLLRNVRSVLFRLAYQRTKRI